MSEALPCTETQCKNQLVYRLKTMMNYHRVLKNNLKALVNEVEASSRNVLKTSGTEFSNGYLEVKRQLTEAFSVILEVNICFQMKKEGTYCGNWKLCASVPPQPEQVRKDVTVIDLKENNADGKLQLNMLLQKLYPSTMMRECLDNSSMDVEPDLRPPAESKPKTWEEGLTSYIPRGLDDVSNNSTTRNSADVSKNGSSPMVVEPSASEVKGPTVVEPSTINKKSPVVVEPSACDVKGPMVVKPYASDVKGPMVVESFAGDVKGPMVVKPSASDVKGPMVMESSASDVRQPVVVEPSACDMKRPVVVEPSACGEKRPVVVEPFNKTKERPVVVEPSAKDKKRQVVGELATNEMKGPVDAEPSAKEESSPVNPEPSTRSAKWPIYGKPSAKYDKKLIDVEPSTKDDSGAVGLEPFTTLIGSCGTPSKAQLLVVGHPRAPQLNIVSLDRATPIFNIRNKHSDRSLTFMCTITSGSEVWDTYEISLEDADSTVSIKDGTEGKPVSPGTTISVTPIPANLSRVQTVPETLCQVQQGIGVLCQEQPEIGMLGQGQQVSETPGQGQSALNPREDRPSAAALSFDLKTSVSPSYPVGQNGMFDDREPRVLIPEFHVYRWDELEVVVSHVVNPHCFFIQQTGKKLGDVMKRMNDECNSSSFEIGDIVFSEGSHVCVWYSEKRLWYRGSIIGIDPVKDGHHDLNSLAKVELVDFGNSVKVPLCCLQDLRSQYRTLPKQALRVSLKDVSPLHGQTWSPEDVAWFKNQVAGRIFYARLNSSHSSGVVAELFMQKGRIGIMRRGETVSQRMVRSGFAKVTGSTKHESRKGARKGKKEIIPHVWKKYLEKYLTSKSRTGFLV